MYSESAMGQTIRKTLSPPASYPPMWETQPPWVERPRAQNRPDPGPPSVGAERQGRAIGDDDPRSSPRDDGIAGIEIEREPADLTILVV